MKLITYIWAGPTTIIGLPFVLLALITGGRARIHTGVLEASGGAVRLLLKHCTFLKGGAAALTLGHVVLAQDQACMDDSRSHERIHVRQCERWGPLFLPAYVAASAVLFVCGKDFYHENPFEREAYREDGRNW